MKKKVTERQMKTERRRASKLIKRALKDKTIRDIVEKDVVKDDMNSKNQAADEWKGLKPFLTINDHLTGHVSHGNLGPKTEIEHLVDKAISEGDLNKAEMLSDHLANRQFSVKIVQAFAAKRFAEKKAEEEATARAKRIKKLSWGFDAKERWEMKGNM
ncbi:protein FAM204A-like isoform X2 [Limulus polyphemus]|nr:protein FAM204A-like isoform X2 [Limulus polyphemus]